MVGNAEVGKTALLSYLTGKSFKDDYTPTNGVGFSVLRRELSEFHIWDIAGQERYRTILKAYYHSKDIIIYALDSTEDANKNKEILKNFQEDISTVCDVSKCFKIIVFTKSDDNQSNLSPDQDQVKKQAYLKEFNDLKIPIIVSSAKESIGLTEINETLSKFGNQISITTKSKEEMVKEESLVSAIEDYSKSLNKKDSLLAKNKSTALEAIAKACRDRGMGKHSGQSNVRYLSVEQVSKIREVIEENKAIVTQHRHSSCFNWFFNLFNPSRLAKRVTSNELVNKLDAYLNIQR